MAGGVQMRNARGRAGQRFQPMAEINVTPFVDVMLVLLVIFMAAAPFLTQGVTIDLPKTDANAIPVVQDPLRVTVDAQGIIYLQDNQITLEDLVPRLIAISQNGYEERIYLRADGTANYESVMKVMANINVAGFSNLGLETEPIAQ